MSKIELNETKYVFPKYLTVLEQIRIMQIKYPKLFWRKKTMMLSLMTMFMLFDFFVIELMRVVVLKHAHLFGNFWPFSCVRITIQIVLPLKRPHVKQQHVFCVFSRCVKFFNTSVLQLYTQYSMCPPLCGLRFWSQQVSGGNVSPTRVD